MIYVFGPKDKPPKDMLVINTTSRSQDWGKELSPFFLGPVKLYDDFVSRNVENGWQYSKVYEQHTRDGEPTEVYWNWAKSGWNNSWAKRYPMGKGAKPLYSLWNGSKMSYVDARKAIYLPLYFQAVKKTKAFETLRGLAGGTIGLWDFDGYDHRALGMSLKDVLNDPKRKMGHAFALAILLSEDEVDLVAKGGYSVT